MLCGTVDDSIGSLMPSPPDEIGTSAPIAAERSQRVQCPNCCQLAPVTGAAMGLLVFHCELCGSTGAATSADLVHLPATE